MVFAEPKLTLSEKRANGANLSKLVFINVPCGFNSNGLPIGLQLIGNVLEEPLLLQVAHQYEQTANVMTTRPDGAFIPA